MTPGGVLQSAVKVRGVAKCGETGGRVHRTFCRFRRTASLHLCCRSDLSVEACVRWEGPRPGTNDEGPSPATVRGPGRLVDVRSDQTLGLGAGALEAGRDVLP